MALPERIHYQHLVQAGSTQQHQCGQRQTIPVLVSPTPVDPAQARTLVQLLLGLQISNREEGPKRLLWGKNPLEKVLCVTLEASIYVDVGNWKEMDSLQTRARCPKSRKTLVSRVMRGKVTLNM